MKKTGMFALLVIAVAAGGWWWLARDRTPELQYRTVAVDRGDIAAEVSANGTLNPVVLVNVGTQVSGTVRRIYADFNQQVKAGEVLAELDPALFQAALAQSTANLANAQAQLNLAEANAVRMETLFKQEYVSQQELDQALAARAQAAAQVRLARAQVTRDQTNLGFSIIRSPVDGTVINRQVDVGQTVAASFQTPTLFQIGKDLTQMQIDSTVSEADIGQIKVGQPVKFRVDAFPGHRIQRRGAAGSPECHDPAERRHLQRGGECRQPRPGADAGDDGQSARRGRDPVATCCACRRRRCVTGRRQAAPSRAPASSAARRCTCWSTASRSGWPSRPASVTRPTRKSSAAS